MLKRLKQFQCFISVLFHYLRRASEILFSLITHSTHGVILVVSLELHSDVSGSTLTELRNVRGHLTVSIRSPLSVPRQPMFKFHHLTVGRTVSTSPRTDRLHDAHRHGRRTEATTIATLYVYHRLTDNASNRVKNEQENYNFFNFFNFY